MNARNPKRTLSANALSQKTDRLHQWFQKSGSVLVAFSGGLDSTLLSAVAARELGRNALAVTALSPTYPREEQREAARLSKLIGIKHVWVHSNELDDPRFINNPPERCYYCKLGLCEKLLEIQRKHKLAVIVDGTNLDDRGDFRPGRKAMLEAGVRSPLLDCGFTKDDIRAASRQLGLPTADKPAMACLASRFPYGATITEQKLKALDTVETGLRKLGFAQIRVRHHGTVARLEVAPAEIERLCRPDVRPKVVALVRKGGFLYVTVDLAGYRTGSMNDTISKEQRKIGRHA